MNEEPRELTQAEARAIVGELSDARMAALLKIGATIEELEEAAALADGAEEMVARVGHTPSRIVAELYEILRPTPEEEGGSDHA